MCSHKPHPSHCYLYIIYFIYSSDFIWFWKVAYSAGRVTECGNGVIEWQLKKLWQQPWWHYRNNVTFPSFNPGIFSGGRSCIQTEQNVTNRHRLCKSVSLLTFNIQCWTYTAHTGTHASRFPRLSGNFPEFLAGCDQRRTNRKAAGPHNTESSTLEHLSGKCREKLRAENQKTGNAHTNTFLCPLYFGMIIWVAVIVGVLVIHLFYSRNNILLICLFSLRAAESGDNALRVCHHKRPLSHFT